VRLSTKLTLGFAAVLLPLAALGYVARFLVENQYKGQFRRALDDAESEVAREYRRLAEDTARAARRIALSDDTLKRMAMLQMQPDMEGDNILPNHVKGLMTALGFDVLEVVAPNAEILACGHFPGRTGDSDPEALHRLRSQPSLVEEKIVENGHVQSVLAVEVAEEIRDLHLVVVFGRRLGQPFLEALHHPARLLLADGTVLAGKLDAKPGWPRRIIELGDDGKTTARVEIAVPDEELARTLSYIAWATGALGLGGLLLSFMLGWFVLRRTVGGVEEVALAAGEVAKGRLDVQVPVRSKDEVGSLATAFNQMIHDLSAARDELVRAERVAAWREIAQRIAHEIKNPLTPIQMAVETLQRAQQKGNQKIFDELFAESSKTILDEVTRLKNIVSEFSAFARMPTPKLQPLDLKEVVEATLPLYSGAVTRELVSAPVSADRDQIVQVLLNLLENARDAAGPDGKVTVRTRRENGRAELEVHDTGPGLSDEARAKLFTPYFTTKTKGTGLGLAIVHRIVSDHGGEIRVANSAGAVFTVSLPAS
jgi:signal transduction histidine kinase